MRFRTLFLVGAALGSLLLQTTVVPGQGTAFTYQGRLNDTGQASSGSYDLRFTIFDARSGGNVIAGPATNSATALTNGLFVVTLDFGAGVFTGPTRWLEIGARTNGAGVFVTLTPRQQLSATPYAILAGDVALANTNIARLNGPTNFFSGVNVLTNANNVLAGNGAGLTNLNAWQLSGNPGTAAGANFLGTADNQPLELHVNGRRALRLEPTTNLSAVNIVGGASINGVDTGVVGATIAGGGTANYNGTPFPNHIGGNYGTIGGGGSNSIAAGSTYTTIGGGGVNTIQGLSATIGGGVYNNISAWDCVIAGGVGNAIQINGSGAAIGGGYNNTNSSYAATIGGGYFNQVQSNAYYSVIGGGYQNNVQSQATISGGGANLILTNSDWSIIGGGAQNTIQALSGYSTVAGGQANTIQTNTPYSTISGGSGNAIQINTVGSAIAGGQQNTIQAGADHSAMGGGWQNTIWTNAGSSIIGGGRGNTVSSNSYVATLSGGLNNIINNNSQYGVIAGGNRNTITSNAVACVIGGGEYNSVGSDHSVINGGSFNNTAGTNDAIGGGTGNFADGFGATVPGGLFNTASGDASLAAGNHAVANWPGCFVWADNSSSAAFSSTSPNQFLVRATGGVGLGTTNTADSGLSLGFNAHLNDEIMYLRPGTDHNHGLAYAGPGVTNYGNSLPDGPVLWGYTGGVLGANGGSGPHSVLSWSSGGVSVSGTVNVTGTVCAANVSCASDRNLKDHFESISPQEILAKVEALPISQWNFKLEDGVKHVGPMAQDFYAAFNLGNDDKHIGTLDEGGVALAAIQGLNFKLERSVAAKDEEIRKLKEQNETLERRLNALAERLDEIAGK